LIGVVSMLQISVYQFIDEKTIYVGICLPSNKTLKMDKSSILKWTITSLLGLGAVVVGYFYIRIFISALRVNNKKIERLELQNKYLNNYNSITRATFDGALPLQRTCSLKRPTLVEEASNNEHSSSSCLAGVTPDKEIICLDELDRISVVKAKKKVSFDNSNSNNNNNNQASQVKVETLLSSIDAPKEKNGSVESEKNTAQIDTILQGSVSLKSYWRSLVLVRKNFSMAFMIFFVTMVYYFSIIPWILTINNIIKFNPFIFYTFTLNCSLNPTIYFIFNSNFRNHCVEFFIYLLSFFYVRKDV
jgi:hypothetical protein